MPGGLDTAKVDALLERARREVDDGLLPSCQLAIARHGEVLVAETFGDATNASRYVIFSATKPIVATAVWSLIDAGKLRLDQTVAETIPEFATNGKDVVTLEQVLLHTSGFPRAPLGAPQWNTREGRLDAFARWRLNWEPGTRYEYHATTAHWVLAELIERVSGVDYRDFIRTRVLEPWGLRRLALGVAPADQGDITTLANVGELPDMDALLASAGLSEMPVTEVTPELLVEFNDPTVRAVGVPGGGGISDASDLAMFYQRLLAGAPGLLSAHAVEQFTAVVRNRFVDWLGVPANRALGTTIAGDDEWKGMRGFGRTCSARTFGHDGAGGQLAFADPETGLSFVYLTNGLDLDVIRQWKRDAAIANRAAICATP